MLYYQPHDIEIFSDYLLSPDNTILLWELEKNYKMPSNWFLNFHIENGSVQQSWNFYRQKMD